MTDQLEHRRPEDMRLGEIGLENFAPYLMNRIMGRYNASLRDKMQEAGLTTPKMRALAVLSVIDGIPIRKLAVYAVVEHSTLSRSLDRLEEQGLVTRSPSAEDHRATLVRITQKGRAAFDRLWPTMAESYAEMFRGIDAAEARAFHGTLQKILRNVRKNPF